MSNEDLTRIGLGKNEAQVYMALLELGTSFASAIAKKSGIYRRTVYDALKDLMEKGLVTHVIKAGKKYFTARDPHKLLGLIKEKEDYVKTILPGLLELQKKEVEEPKAEIIVGKEGMRTLIEEQLSNKEFYGIGMRREVWEIFRFALPHIIKRSIRSGNKAKIIAHEEVREFLEKLPEENVQVRYLPKEYYSPSTIMIWKNKVSTSVHGDKPFIVVIESEKVKKTYMNYFNMLWEIAKP